MKMEGEIKEIGVKKKVDKLILQVAGDLNIPAQLMKDSLMIQTAAADFSNKIMEFSRMVIVVPKENVAPVPKTAFKPFIIKIPKPKKVKAKVKKVVKVKPVHFYHLPAQSQAKTKTKNYKEKYPAEVVAFLKKTVDIYDNAELANQIKHRFGIETNNLLVNKLLCRKGIKRVKIRNNEHKIKKQSAKTKARIEREDAREKARRKALENSGISLNKKFVEKVPRAKDVAVIKEDKIPPFEFKKFSKDELESDFDD